MYIIYRYRLMWFTDRDRWGWLHVSLIQTLAGCCSKMGWVGNQKMNCWKCTNDFFVTFIIKKEWKLYCFFFLFSIDLQELFLKWGYLKRIIEKCIIKKLSKSGEWKYVIIDGAVMCIGSQ